MNLEDFRSQYPQYDSVSDGKLSTAIYGKYYQDTMTSAQFVEMIGLKPEESRGFISAFKAGIKNPIDLMTEESMAREMINVTLGKTDKERADEHDAYFGNPVNRDLNEINGLLNEHEAAGKTDTREYRNLEAEFQQKRELRDADAKPPEFSWEAFKGMIKDGDSATFGTLGAELVNALVADPYIMMTPIGWPPRLALAASSQGGILDVHQHFPGSRSTSWQ